MPCNTVVVADGTETEHSPNLFPIPYSGHQGHCCPMKDMSMTYLRTHLHPQLHVCQS